MKEEKWRSSKIVEMEANRNSISDDTGTPLLLPKQNRRHHWWDKILDIEEAKHQLLFSLPMILTNLFYYLITLVSVMLVGHLGELQLAGATLANSWFSVTGVALMVILLQLFSWLCFVYFHRCWYEQFLYVFCSLIWLSQLKNIR